MSADTPLFDKLMAIKLVTPASVITGDELRCIYATESQLRKLVDAEVAAAIERCAKYFDDRANCNKGSHLLTMELREIARGVRALASTTNKEES